MKMRARKVTLAVALGVLVALVATLLFADLLPDLKGIKQARRELENLESEIQQTIISTRLGQTERAPEDTLFVPELPEIAAFITSLRNAQREAGVKSLRFESVRTETRDITDDVATEAVESPYIMSQVSVSFSASIVEAAAFLDLISTSAPKENVEYVKLTSASDTGDEVEVSMAVWLYGVPR